MLFITYEICVCSFHFFSACYADAKRLIGRRFTDASVQSDIKLWPFKVIAGPGDKSTIVVQYKGEEKQVAAEMPSVSSARDLLMLLSRVILCSGPSRSSLDLVTSQ
ncbi:Os12g0569700 [Oryza sativa Japonica Group]|uniref:Os12g0569700 protein n=1 Tax=Oryza sativa subsp. japonica TaxID=39947 RepID=A0A0P0YBQ2_ORYSJ|nr:Os12g0569700 [Oryza sativa Japonica Group]